MKKVILFILSFFMTLKVSALTYYSDFNKEGITDIPVTPTDLVEVEKTLKYEMYEEEVNYIYLKDSDLEETGNFITSYTDWTTDIYEIDFNEEVEKYYEYAYAPAKNYNYLQLKNISVDTDIDYLEIYDSQNDRYVYRGYFGTFPFNTGLIFKLTSVNNLANLKITIRSKDENFQAQINASYDFPGMCTPDFITTIGNETIDDFSIYDVIYPSVKVYTIEEFKTQKDNYELFSTHYRNKVIYKEYKQVIRNYLGTYSNNPNDLVDYDHPKIFYNYKIRDKVEINDNYTGINDIILYSTVENLEVTSDDKIYINIPFLEETLEFDIPKSIDYSNYILIDPYELNSLYDELDNAYYLVDKKNLEIKEMILQSDEFTDSVVNDLNNCYTEKNILKEQKKTLKEEKEVKKGSIFYIFIILVLSVILGMCRFMSTKKND